MSKFFIIKFKLGEFRILYSLLFFMVYAICDHLYNLKAAKNTHGGVLLFFTKSNTFKWVFFTFLNCANGTRSRYVSHMSKISS